MKKYFLFYSLLFIVGFSFFLIGCKDPEPVHEHTFSDNWKSNETHHWHESICRHNIVKGKESHNFGEYVSNNDATSKVDGTKSRFCSICGKNDTVTDLNSRMNIRKMVLIPAGTFQMGSNTTTSSNNKPVHEVTISKPFYMSKYEITQADWKSIMGTNPSYYQGESYPSAAGEIQENRPVEYVSWYQILVYCNKRSIADGLTPCYKINDSTNPEDWGTIPTSDDLSNNVVWSGVVCDWNANGYRLPTEAEWEYAARAGDNTVDAHIYSGTTDESILSDYAWYKTYSEEVCLPHEVGKKKPNQFGLYDMTGNINEFCWNWNTSQYGEFEGGIDPKGPETGTNKSYRGGTFSSDFPRYYLDVTIRAVMGAEPYCPVAHVGFRVVHSAE